MPTPPYRVKALYEYRSDHADDLSFDAGQHITVDSVEDEEWLRGSYEADGERRQGMFPRNFVQEVRQAPQPPVVRPQSNDDTQRATQAAPEQHESPTRVQAAPAAMQSTRPEESVLAERRSDEPAAKAAIDEPATEPAQTTQSRAELPHLDTAVEKPAQQTAKTPVTPAAESAAPAQRSVKSSSFKDRIAAFNNPAAAPVAPKPMPKPSLAKKPFVAPPPSKESYVAPAPAPRATQPASISRAPTMEPDAAAEPVRASIKDDEDADLAPKMSLKDRIAALQNERAQQAAKRAAAESGPAEQVTSTTAADTAEDDDFEAKDSSTTTDAPRPLARTESHRSQRSLHAQRTGSSVQSPPQLPTAVPMARSSLDDEEPLETAEEESENATTSEPTAEAAPEETDEDPEEARRRQIRERMAKMSGMGMGMHMALGMPGMGPRPTKPKTAQRQSPYVEDVAAPAAQREEEVEEERELPRAVPMPGLPTMPLPETARPQTQDSDVVPQADETVATETQAQGTAATPVLARSPTMPPHARQASIKSIRSIQPGTYDADHANAPLASPPIVPTSPRMATIPQSSYFAPPAEEEPLDPAPTPVVGSPPQVPLPGQTASPPRLARRSTDLSRAAAPPVPISPPQLPRQSIEQTLRSSPGDASSEDESHEPAIGQSSSAARAIPPMRAAAPPVPSQTRPAAPLPPTSGRPPIPSQHFAGTSEDDSDSPAPPSRVHPAALKVLRQESQPQSMASESEGEGYAADDDTDAASVLDTKRQSAFEPSSPVERRSLPPMPRIAPPPPRSVPMPPSNLQTQSLGIGLDQSDDTARDTHEDTTPGADDYTSEVEPRRSLARRSTDRGKRSTDVGRSENYAARDVDLSGSTDWFNGTNTPPPGLANRSDLLWEMDENTKTQRGKTVVTKEIYVLYHDLSQSVISGTLGAGEQRPVFKQEHQAPPPLPSRDDLERAHARFGSRLLSAAKSKENTSVGSGDAAALIAECTRSLDGALGPIGTRSFGVAIYTNIGNASVNSIDEILPGDVLHFRNAKLQGHKGAMKSKYAVEVGKPDHCGVVVEWDGTKKKVKVLEQVPHGKGAKVTANSYKLNDLKSGEIKVFRVIGRDYVGWQS